MHIKHWEKCLSLIKKELSPQSYKTWFKPIKSVKYKNQTLILEVPNKFFYEWIEDHYLNILNNSILEVLGVNGKIESYSQPRLRKKKY